MRPCSSFIFSISSRFLSYLAEDCSYNLTSKFNRVMSPGYPSSYPNGIVCKYFFEAAESNAIQVQFTHMNLEMQPPCGDFITFYDLNNGMEQRLCKNRNGIVWTSRGNRALMTFKTDARSTSSGFSGFFYQIRRRMECFKIIIFSLLGKSDVLSQISYNFFIRILLFTPS